MGHLPGPNWSPRCASRARRPLRRPTGCMWDFLLDVYDQQIRRGCLPSRTSAYRQLPPDVSLEAVLCFKYLRTVAHDNTGLASTLCSATTAPRWHSGPATPGLRRGSPVNGWTAASRSSTGAEPWLRSRPPPNRSCSGPAAVGVPTANPQSTRTPSWTTSDTAHRRLLPALRQDPGSYPHQASTHPSLEESATDIIIEQQPCTESLDNDTDPSRCRHAQREAGDPCRTRWCKVSGDEQRLIRNEHVPARV